MQKYIVHEKDNGLAIEIVVMGYDPSYVADRLGIDSYVIIDESKYPSSKEYRDAWVLDVAQPSAIAVDAQKAINLSLTQLRLKRDTKLSILDEKYIELQRDGITRDGLTKEDLDNQRRALLDSTEPLKSLGITGVITLDEANEIIKPLEDIEYALTSA